jgi:hypothetical protein
MGDVMDEQLSPGPTDGSDEAPKPYEPPTLTELGSIEELTAGFGAAAGDDAFTGTAT